MMKKYYQIVLQSNFQLNEKTFSQDLNVIYVIMSSNDNISRYSEQKLNFLTTFMARNCIP